MDRKRGVNNSENKLLYDPNQRKQRRLGAFSMGENVNDEEENNEEVEQEETQGEEQNTSQQENQEQNEQVSDEQGQNTSSGVGSTIKNAASTAKNVAGNAAKNAVKQAGKTVGKVIGALAKKLLAFIVANPWVLLIIAIVIIILLIILILAGGANEEQDPNGLYGYDYFAVYNRCDEVTVYDTPDGVDGTYTMEEYIAGVVKAEVGGFDQTVLEVGAIAARTFLLAQVGNSDSCTIAGNTTKQVFRYVDPTSESDQRFFEASRNTRGLVITKNGNLMTTYYDAACYMGEDESNYFIGYGSLTLGEQHIQEIPMSWANSQAMIGYINDSKGAGVLCYGNHGYGLSQWGAQYLATQEGFSRDEILNYYYGSDIQLMSIYRTNSCNANIYNNTIFIGDSRTKGMIDYGILSDNEATYGVGYGYNWLVGINGPFYTSYTDNVNSGIAEANNMMASGESYNIVIWLGVNDLYNVENYYEKYYELATGEWANHNLFIVEVGPVDETKTSSTTNASIREFNNYMSSQISSSGLSNLIYLDIDYDIQDSGDGLHYGSTDYQNIYDAIINEMTSSTNCTGTFSTNCVIYAQNDSNWNYKPLGNSSTNMGNSGCAVTSVAIAIGCSGTPLTVNYFDAGVFIDTLNSYGSCFTSSGGIYWNCGGIRQIAPNVNLVVSDTSFGSYSLDRKKQVLESYASDNTFIIVHHYYNHPRGHYVVYSYMSGNNVITLDPAGGIESTIPISELDQIVVYRY